MKPVLHWREMDEESPSTRQPSPRRDHDSPSASEPLAAELDGPLGPNPFSAEDPHRLLWDENSRRVELEIAELEVSHSEKLRVIASRSTPLVPKYHMAANLVQAE